MITPMISPIRSSMIKSMINPDGGGAETRYFIDLDPIQNSHYLLSNQITFSGNFSVLIDIATLDSASSVMSSFTDSDNKFNLFLTASGTIQFSNKVLGVGTDRIGTEVVNDGKLTTVVFSRDGTQLTIGTDLFTVPIDDVCITTLGQQNSALKFKGIQSKPKFTDNSGAPVTTTFKLDKPTGNTELSVEGNNTLTYISIPNASRELYQLSDDKTQWDNISPPVQVLPSIIEIA